MEIRCNCGGTFRATTLKKFDMGKLVGLPRLVLPWVTGLRCDTKGHETVPGEIIELTRDMLAAEIVAQRETRLAPDPAAYLRRYLGWTQNELAEKMHVARGTVADWERGEDEISPQHDFILRTLVFTKVMRKIRGAFSVERAATFFEAAVASLDTVHAGPPGKMPPAHVIAARLEASSPVVPDAGLPRRFEKGAG